MAITWRNVSDTGTNEALRSLMAASAGIGNSFTNLQGVVRDAELADRQALEQTRERNTNEFLDTLQSRYTTPEAMQQAIASGEAEALRQSFGTRINSGATRGAADTRLSNLRTQDTAGRQFTNARQDDADQAFLSQAQAAALRGDPAAQQFVDQVSARNQGRAAQTLFDAEKALFGQTVAQNTETRAGEKHVSGLKNDEAQRNSAYASAAASRASAANSAVRTSLAQVELKDRQEANAFQKIIQNEVQQHQAQSAMDKQRIRKIAMENPSMATLDSKGELDINRMGRDQREAFESILSGHGLSLNTYTGSDTAAQQRTYDKLVAAGAPLAVTDKVKAGGEWFNTAAPTPVGNDAVTKAQKERQQALLDQRKNDAAGGIPLKTKDFPEAMKLISPSFPSKEEGDQARRAVSNYFKDGGVEIEGVKHYLPASTIARIVQGAKNPWGWNDTEDYVKSELEKTEKDFKEKLSGAVKSDTDAKVRSVASPPLATTNQRRSTRFSN